MTLPPPEAVRERIASKQAIQPSDQPKYDLHTIHEKAMIDFKRMGFSGLAKAQFNELIHPHLQNERVKNLCIGWSTKYQSITFSLFDSDGEIKSHIIRSAKHNGNAVKWKTYGSKLFTPHKIRERDSLVFIASGIGEYALFELMDVSYICPQSDSMTAGISQSVIDEVQGKTIVYLQDNDESGVRLGVKLQELFSGCVFVRIDFIHVMADQTDWDIKRGYDFRDFCNWAAEKYDVHAWNVVDQMVVREINFKIEEMRCLSYRMKQGATS